MQLLPLLLLVSAQILTSNAQCNILLIPPTDINNLTPCGYGSLTAGCDCCRGGQVACQHLTQVCTPGLLGYNYYCANNPAFVPTCASQNLANCGNGCMPSSATCCPGQAGWCPAGRSCGTQSNCILDGVNSYLYISPSSAEATSPVFSPSNTVVMVPSPSPSTTGITTPSFGAGVSVLNSATSSTSTLNFETSKTTSTTSTLSFATSKINSTISTLNPATRKTTRTTSTSTSTTQSQTPSSIGSRKEHGGIRTLAVMAIMNVFIFC